MAMIEVAEETARMLREKAEAKQMSLDRYLSSLAEAGPPAVEDSSKMTPRQWSAEWRAWAASHRRVEHFVDDSRESIYEGRGE